MKEERLELVKPSTDLPQITCNWKGEDIPWQEYVRIRTEAARANPARRPKRMRTSKRVQESIRLGLRQSRNVSEIARENNVTPKVVEAVLRQMPDEYEARRNERAEAIIDDLWGLNQAVLNSVTPEDIKKASLKDKAITISILTEKAQLMSGDPTEIVQNNVSDRELIILSRKAGINLPANVKERIAKFAPDINFEEVVREEARSLPEGKQA